MAKVTLELPDEVAAKVQEMLKRLEETTRAAQALDGSPVDANAALASITEATNMVGLELKRRALQGFDVDAARVTIAGKPHTKVGRYEATYKTLEGEVTVTRNLYRPDGERNAKTVDLIGVRLGVVEDGRLRRRWRTCSLGGRRERPRRRAKRLSGSASAGLAPAGRKRAVKRSSTSARWRSATGFTKPSSSRSRRFAERYVRHDQDWSHTRVQANAVFFDTAVPVTIVGTNWRWGSTAPALRP